MGLKRNIRTTTGGFTLLEVLLVAALMALMTALAVRSFRSIARSELRSTAGKMAGAMRYLFDRASTTGRVHRLVIDFEQKRYWAEVSDDQFFLPREKEDEEFRQRQWEELQREKDLAAERAAQGLAPEEEQVDEDDDGLGLGFGQDQDSHTPSLDDYMPKPYKEPQARFKPFRENTVKPVQLKETKFVSMYTPRLAEPIAEGQGFVYFFPLGFAEAAIIHLSDSKEENIFSLVVHPLTGRVQIFSEYIDPPVDEFDDEGNAVREDY